MRCAWIAWACRQRIGWYLSVYNRPCIGSSYCWQLLSVFCHGKFTFAPATLRASHKLSTFHRLIVRVATTTIWPDDFTREILATRSTQKKNGDDLLVAWSRSTSASSIYRWVFRFHGNFFKYIDVISFAGTSNMDQKIKSSQRLAETMNSFNDRFRQRSNQSSN